MEARLQFELIFWEPGLCEVRVRGSNGIFAGQADAYVGPGELERCASELEGFPRGASDVREVVLGAFGPEWAGGAVRLRFSCIDPAGHAVVDVTFESNGAKGSRNMVPETAQFRMALEAAAMDDLIPQLKRIALDKSGVATLSGMR